MKSTLIRDSFKDSLLIYRGEVEKNVFERGLYQLELIIRDVPLIPQPHKQIDYPAYLLSV